jgi:hypothetical protein
MTAASTQTSESLQVLIDSRLDTIDRMLLGRLPRAERLEVVREVEAQIFELLQERDPAELTREDVLAVLARLDPPEAYLPEEAADERERVAAPRMRLPVRAVPQSRSRQGLTAKASGILGLSMLACVFLLPIAWLSMELLNSEALLIVLWLGTSGLMFIGGIVGLVLSIYSRVTGAWGIVGLITGIFSVLIALAAGGFLLLELL